MKGLEALKLIPQGWGVLDTKNGKNYDGDKLIKIIEKELKVLDILLDKIEFVNKDVWYIDATLGDFTEEELKLINEVI